MCEKLDPIWEPSELSIRGSTPRAVDASGRGLGGAGVLDSHLHADVAIGWVEQGEIGSLGGKWLVGKAGDRVRRGGSGEGDGFRRHAIDGLGRKIARRGARRTGPIFAGHECANPEDPFAGLGDEVDLRGASGPG